MAREVLGVVGAAVGGYFGGPVGAQIGYAIGSGIGSIIDPQYIDGPDLADASLQTSRDGIPIPIAWGIIHVVGNIIQINPIVESTKKVGGKKGGVKENIALRTFAIGIARTIEGPIAGLLRVWENNKLVYDVREGSTFPAKDNTAFEEATTLYLGTETQLPDPELESHTGVGTTPAYRALAYIVFNNKDITNFGSSIPSYRFELSTSGALGDCNEIWQVGTITPDLHVAGQDKTTGIWNHGVIIGVGDIEERRRETVFTTNADGNYTEWGGFSPGVQDGIAEVFYPECQWYNYAGPQLRNKMAGSTFDLQSWNDIGSPVFTWGDGLDGAAEWSRIMEDDDPGVTEGVFKGSTLGSLPPPGTTYTVRFTVFKALSSQEDARLEITNEGGGTALHVLFNPFTGDADFSGGNEGTNGTFEVRDNKNIFEVYLQQDSNTIDDRVIVSVKGAAGGTGLGSIRVYDVAVFANASFDITIGMVRGGCLEPKKSAGAPSSDIDISRTLIDTANHDNTEGGYYFEFRPMFSHSEISRDVEILSLNTDTGLLYYDWSTQLLTATDGTNTATVPLTLVAETKYRLGVIWGDFLRVGVDGVWGTAVAYDGAFAGGGDFNILRNQEAVSIYRELNGYFIPYSDAFDEISILMTGIEGETVGGITQDLCGLVDVTAIDTTQVDTIGVRGFLAAGGYSAADTIRSLQRTYFFDYPEIDGQLVAILRGGAVVATITRDDMVIGSEVTFETAREQGVEFPNKLHLAYASAETDYTPTKATSERRSADIKSKSELTIEVPINLVADEATQVADKIHKVAWAELEGTAKFAVSEVFARLVPSDPVSVELDTGVFKRIRIQKITAVDGMMQAEGVVDRISAYSSDVTAPIPVDPIEPGSNLISNTVFEIMDLPALLQSQDTLHIYVSAYGSDSGPWQGAVIEQLLDTEWIERGRVTFPETMGVLAADLASHPRGIDTTNTITVTLSDDVIETITQAEFDAGGNTALVGDEIINFRDVAANGDDWDLSHLNRAAMNTNILSHSTGDRFVKLVAPTLIELSSAFLNEELTFRCYSIGNVPSASDETTFTFTGYSQIEWTPLNATKEIIDADWIFNWTHNERIGAPNETIVSQHFLNFAILLIDGVTSKTVYTTDDSLSYTEAEQIVNFGGAVADFDIVAIYGNNRFTGFGLPPATPILISGDAMLLESGGSLMLEDGSGVLLLEIEKLALESGGVLLNEANDGTLLLE